MLDRWFEQVIHNRENMDQRVIAAQVEAEYHGEIEIEDEETVIITDE